MLPRAQRDKSPGNFLRVAGALFICPFHRAMILAAIEERAPHLFLEMGPPDHSGLGMRLIMVFSGVGPGGQKRQRARVAARTGFDRQRRQLERSARLDGRCSPSIWEVSGRWRLFLLVPSLALRTVGIIRAIAMRETLRSKARWVMAFGPPWFSMQRMRKWTPCLPINRLEMIAADVGRQVVARRIRIIRRHLFANLT